MENVFDFPMTVQEQARMRSIGWYLIQIIPFFFFLSPKYLFNFLVILFSKQICTTNNSTSLLRQFALMFENK